MREPNFWHTSPARPSWQARLLSPVSALSTWATARRVAKSDGYRANVPIICIGNINLGGTGKTPTAIAIAEQLTSRGHSPAIVTRGYGGKLNGPVKVDETGHTADDVGDEALLLSVFASVYKSVDRAAGVRMAETSGHDIILLDDGHQNPSVVKDISIIVVNARSGFGNGRVVPSGPLREPVAAGISRGDALLSIGEPEDQMSFATLWPHALPHLTAQLRPLATGMPWAGLPVVAFAGIGVPERFFSMLRKVGANVIKAEPLSDHQPLTPALMARLEQDAISNNARLVTTEKDAVRLPENFRSKVLPFPVRLDVVDWEPLQKVIDVKGLDIRLR